MLGTTHLAADYTVTAMSISNQWPRTKIQIKVLPDQAFVRVPGERGSRVEPWCIR